MKDRLKKYWNSKSLFGKLGDLFFVLFVTAMLFPQGRLTIGGAINRVKAYIIQPSASENGEIISDTDFNWKLVDINNNEVDLNEAKGKVIFINLWATWCPPCVGEMPEIQKLYNNYKNNDNIMFYMITSDPVSKMKKFVTNRKYDFPVFHAKGETPVPFKVRSIPTTFVLSKSGKIVIRETGAANWGGKKMVEIIDNLIKE